MFGSKKTRNNVPPNIFRGFEVRKTNDDVFNVKRVHEK